MSDIHDMAIPIALSRRQFLGRTVAAGSCIVLAGRAASEEQPPSFLREWGKHGTGEGQFSACVGIAIGPGDTLYTAEFRNQRVQKFTLEGKFLGAFPVQPHAG